MTPHPSRRAAFTLLELLVVIAIIAILASLLLGVVNMLRYRARALLTETRMQNVLGALTDYGQSSGGPVGQLQNSLGLGGASDFASLEVIHTVIKAGGAGRNDPKYLVAPGNSTYVWALTGDESAEQQPYWNRVFDVRPPTTGAVAAGWYEQVWPQQWPDTDWDKPIPGTVPPILRFPWGRPGLRLDGTICDANQPAATIAAKVVEYASQSDWRQSVNGVTVQMPNAWVTHGGSAATASIWTFTVASAGDETSWVTGTVTGKRSDPASTAVTADANQPLPFDLGWLSPLASLGLLKAAGVVAADGDADYRKSRRTSQSWNDAWGNPLVVSYALFQPERYSRVFDGQNRRDLLLHGALTAYKYNRSIYLAVGAIGPTIRDRTKLDALAASTTAAGDAPVLRALWTQVRECCKAYDWTERSFDQPPWKGVRNLSTAGERCFLTSPLELH